MMAWLPRPELLHKIKKTRFNEVKTYRQVLLAMLPTVAKDVRMGPTRWLRVGDPGVLSETILNLDH